MWFVAVRTWLAQGAKHLIFLRTVKNSAVFHGFYAIFFMNVRFILCDLLAFLVEIALALACTWGHAHNVPFESSALIGQFLNSWHVTFQKHLIQSIWRVRYSLPSLLFTLACAYTPYSQKIWRKLNLADWPQSAKTKILADSWVQSSHTPNLAPAHAPNIVDRGEWFAAASMSWNWQLWTRASFFSRNV